MRFGAARGNQANVRVFKLNVNHIEQAPQAVETNRRVTRLVASRRIHQYKQGVGKYGNSLFKAYAVFTPIGLGFSACQTNASPLSSNRTSIA